MTIFSFNSLFSQWQQLPCNGNINSIVINGNKIFAGNGTSGIWLSQDNGLTWTPKNNGLPVLDVHSLAIDGNNLFAGTVLGVYLSQNNGDSWTSAGAYGGNITSIAIMGDRIYIGTYLSGIFMSQNNGGNWTQINNGLNTEEIGSLLVADSNIYAGTLLGVFFSQDFGNHWTHLDNGIPHISVNSFLRNGIDIYAGTYYGGSIYKTVDNGTSWTVNNNGLPNNEDVYSFTDNNSGIFAGAGSGVYFSKDSGNLWNPINNGLPSHPNVLSLAINQSYLFAGTDLGVWRFPLSELGINDYKPTPNYSVYPNPADDYIIISTATTFLSVPSVTIYNLEGNQLMKVKLGNQNENKILLTCLSKGMYFLRIQNGDHFINKEIILK